AIGNGYASQIRPQIEAFLVRVGRRKFLTPLYRAYKENGQLETAKEIYEKARPNYHAVSRNTMDKLLEMGS
ncbi:MAG: leukotriene A4 hydrolase C-terminal domain-containing protein, partial [Phaeodactylibacter sp.]|nr:leukotriene A4 hydrolase C-terminal domain-containing protein [Phaeodactylibacter sp.]